MTQRVLGPTGGRRRKRLLLFLPFVAIAALILVMGASATVNDSALGFEASDGNLNSDTIMDWNSFTPTWTGTAPSQLASELFSGWQFNGATDAQATTSDNGFKGGTKQDDSCAGVIGTKAPNKDDLKRIYIAHSTAPADVPNTSVKKGDVILTLAWVRIPQNTTSASAHVAFEFNQADPNVAANQCGSGSDSLVKRTVGDLLIVYDFAGSTTDNPILTVRKWVTSGTCEVSNDSAPCWGPAQNLTAFGTAVAKVNTVSTAQDTVAPSTETLGLNEFGEAGIDLSASNIFTAGTCSSFGQAEGVSRSSGNSGTAAMEDLVGPIGVSITNCGSLLIHKTDGTNGLAGATFTATPGQTDSNGNVASSSTFVDEGTGPPANSALNGYYCLDNMKIGQSTLVHESAAPARYNADANDQTITVTNTDSCATRLAAQTITEDGSDFVDTPQVGAIKITKVGKDKNCTGAGVPAATCKDTSLRLLNGAVFELKSGSTVKYTSDPTSGTGSSAGVTCIDNVTPGSYTLHESTVPTGYSAAADQSVTIAANTSCSGTGDNAPLLKTVTNQPLTTITVSTTPQIAGTTTSTAVCTDVTGDVSGATPHTTSAVVPGTYHCTVVIDP